MSSSVSTSSEGAEIPSAARPVGLVTLSVQSEESCPPSELMKRDRLHFSEAALFESRDLRRWKHAGWRYAWPQQSMMPKRVRGDVGNDVEEAPRLIVEMKEHPKQNTALSAIVTLNLSVETFSLLKREICAPVPEELGQVEVKLIGRCTDVEYFEAGERVGCDMSHSGAAQPREHASFERPSGGRFDGLAADAKERIQV